MGLQPHDEALQQLRDIEDASNGRFRVRRSWVPDPRTLCVDLAVWCGGFERRAGGLPIRNRERFTISIPDDFPFVPPSVCAAHDRFAGFGHVQWKRSLCLYQSTESEWSPRDGMFGFLTRLVDWLSHGARGEFEPEGAPLHPPVAYQRSGITVIPRIDTPAPNGAPWIGLAQVNVVHEARVDLVGWCSLEETPASGLQAGAAILLDTSMPYEYPAKVSDLFGLLEARGVTARFRPLFTAATRNAYGTPLYVIVGTPMRGVSGARQLEQHVAAWRVDAAFADKLRALLEVAALDDPAFREIEDALLQSVASWAAEAKIEWATVREARPAVTRRRDEHAPMNYFAGKAVAVWGCGALGGHIAELLARAGVRRLVLRDRSTVAPGVLVRQPFEDLDIGRHKAELVAARVARIDPSIVVEPHRAELLVDPLDCDDWTDGTDVVVDASASLAVLEKVELRRAASVRRVPLVNLVVDGGAERALLTIARAEHTGAAGDVARRAKLAACARRELRDFADAFWPVVRAPVFQPEPGCSASTFRGSAADLVGLAATGLNLAAVSLSDPAPDATACAHFIAQPHVRSPPGCVRHACVVWPADVICDDAVSGYQIRIAAGAWRELAGWTVRSARVHGPSIETGGILFGERNDACRVIWVDEILGPPPDSRARADVFECGVEGVLAACAEKRARTRRSVEYIGMWHTHPDAKPIPSATDREGMARLTSLAGTRTQKALLVILGTSAGRPASHGAYLFSRADFVP
ncbi:ThiF family adenylyltransferase [Sandaracinus amylolyticus]|uniref:Sulfur carrier protein adenylyltransferase ThiF n=1 Tax=Sandaracinus amylolyticus TaxID=927083 RepID=A0A0F6YLX1_9BACT|nr:ThiF family adenylyltransferase [Sandaracinus amylolyticus]AKF10013.1 Sulfur carrier protein adenylyltransferase ThiF [Sandaracinus amylolyticus]